MVREVAIIAGDRWRVGHEVLGFEPLTVGGQDELGLKPGCRRARLERRQGVRHLARRGDGDVDVVGLKHAAPRAGKVGPVRFALAQAPERRFLVAECLQERERKLRGVKRLPGEVGDGLFYLDSVHTRRP